MQSILRGALPAIVSSILAGAAMAEAPLRAPADSTVALRRAAAFLWDAQHDDGGWHSETYGLLRSGQALTPMVLDALADVPRAVVPWPTERGRQAVAFLRAQLSEEGVLGVADPDVLEYPVYSTAYALRCLVRLGGDADRQRIERMTGYLCDQQYCEQRGFSPTNSAYGGWGFGSVQPLGEPGHMDLAHTRRVLSALSAAGKLDAQSASRAEVFLWLVQRHPKSLGPHPLPPGAIGRPDGKAPYDGGFFFSPVVLAANKGRLQEDPGGAHYRSYATATCDGVLALLAAGVSRDDERVEAARHWLEHHPRVDYPEGIPTDYSEPWGGAVHFYHLAVRSEALAALDEAGDWRARIGRHLVACQQADGRFVNRRSALMKEDDPLIATALAVVALTHAAR